MVWKRIKCRDGRPAAVVGGRDVTRGVGWRSKQAGTTKEKGESVLAGRLLDAPGSGVVGVYSTQGQETSWVI